MVKKLVAILVGSFCLAIGINLFVIPNHLLDGGIIGLGLIGKYAFGLKPGLTIIILSFPLYMIALFHNRSYFYNGVHGLLISSFFIDLFRPISLWDSPAPILISSLIAGVLIGTGIGTMLSVGISTGGTDLLALILSKITTINAGIFIFIIDSIVLFFGWFVVKEVTFIYSCVMVLVIGLTTFTLLNVLTKKSS